MPSFSNKNALRFVVTLATGTFGSSKNNQIILEGFRATVEIDKAGWNQIGTLRAQIYGVSQSDMNAATVYQLRPDSILAQNQIDVYAINGPQETLVFSGNIVNAWGNYQSMPDVFLQIQAQTAYHAQLTPVAPRSYKGSIDVASVMGQIAQSVKLADGRAMAFENNGVNIQAQNLYLANTSLEQAKELAQMFNIGLYIDDNILAITPTPNTPRGGIIPEISAQSGLISYPTFDGYGVNFQMLYNPAVRFGGSIKLVTSLKSVSDIATQWIVTSISHRLESEKPGGAWFSSVKGNLNGLAVTR